MRTPPGAPATAAPSASTAPDGPVDVEPVLDRLLVFQSERVEHEVLPARAPRWAVTAWFRPRDPLGG